MKYNPLLLYSVSFKPSTPLHLQILFSYFGYMSLNLFHLELLVKDNESPVNTLHY